MKPEATTPTTECRSLWQGRPALQSQSRGARFTLTALPPRTERVSVALTGGLALTWPLARHLGVPRPRDGAPGFCGISAGSSPGDLQAPVLGLTLVGTSLPTAKRDPDLAAPGRGGGVPGAPIPL